MLTEPSLNGIGMGNLMVHAFNSSILENKTQIPLLNNARVETARQPQKSGEEVVQTRTEENPGY